MYTRSAICLVHGENWVLVFYGFVRKDDADLTYIATATQMQFGSYNTQIYMLIHSDFHPSHILTLQPWCANQPWIENY